MKKSACRKFNALKRKKHANCDSLESLADYYDISYDGAHRALADCHINKKVYDCLAKEIANPSEAAKLVPVCPRCGNLLKKRNGNPFCDITKEQQVLDMDVWRALTELDAQTADAEEIKRQTQSLK